MHEFRMPSLGAEMESGRLLEWRVKPGDPVKRGDIVAVVDTDKAAIEVEVWDTGVVDRLLIEPGTRVPVGTSLATIREPGEKPGAPVPMPTAAAPTAPSLRAPAEPQRPALARVAASPAARKRAAELGVDLASVKGSGPHGTIGIADVDRAATTKSPRQAMRATIAAAMARSKREIPHYYLGSEIDLGRAMSWLSEENQKRPITERLLPAVVLVKAVALALKQVPELNGFFRTGRFKPSAEVHVGVAISLREGGLIAPAIHDVDKKDLATLMRDLSGLVARARAGTLRSSELSDATITVTNLGDQGVESVFGVIYPPQVAIIGFGRIAERPWVSDGAVASRPMVTASLSADHRASDGHRGAVFLNALARILQEPEKL